MKNKKILSIVFRSFFPLVLSVTFLYIVFVIVTQLIVPSLSTTAVAESEGLQPTIKKVDTTEENKGLKTGTMNLGKFLGQVAYDKEQDYYFLELRGARFPFKSSPLEAQDVLLEAPGETYLEKNTSLLYGIMGKEVLNVTLLIDPNEEDEVMPAATDIQRYIQIANPRKFAGIAYTKPGGKLKKSVVRGSQIQALKDATTKTPKILIKGPKSGAKKTRVLTIGGSKVIVEGRTYEELYKAADRICVTLMKMLCGSSDCPDAAACATGGNCGCGQ